MHKHLILAGAVILAAIAQGAQAQSPWENGTFKNYDQSPGTSNGSSGGTALGLQGYSLSPNSDSATEPAVPAVTTPTQPIMQSGGSAAPSSSSPTVPSVVPANADPAIRQRVGALVDSSFVTTATQSFQAMVTTSQLAEKNAGSSAMQQFASQIVSIYAPMVDELTALAKKNDISTVPMQESQSDLDGLKKLSGNDFDKEYMRLQQKNLYVLSFAFSREASSGQNTALKSYASSHQSMLDQQKDVVQKSYIASQPANALMGAK